MADTLTIYGEVVFRQETFLASQFEGRLSDFSLLTGDRVEKGQKIAVIIPRNREALLHLDNQTPAEVRELAEKEIKTIPLFSPIDGVVLDVSRHSGDVVQPGEQIAHIGEDRLLEIRGQLPVKYIEAARQSQQVQATFYGLDLPPLHLPIAAVSADIDPLTQSTTMRLDLPNPAGHFRPGMRVKLSLLDQHHSGALTVPRSALREDEGVFNVFVLESGRAKKQEVKTGIMEGNRVEILEGVKNNDAVITDGVYSLEDGMEVEVQ
jgi:membrane fusion protein (multidrug efflux system)